MLRRITCCALPALVALALLGQGIVGISAQGQASLRVAPTKVAIGKQVTVIGSHLQPKKIYSLILLIPNDKKPFIEQFLPKFPTSDRNGSFKLKLKIPIVTRCGKAEIESFASKSKQIVRAHFTLSGCSAPKRIKSPPPPPKKHK
jgi:hypothetical protein